MRKRSLIYLLIGVIAIGVSALNADTLSVGLGSEFSVIQGSLPGIGRASRIVVATPLSGLPSQCEVDFAEITIPYFLPTGFTGILQVEGKVLTRSWNRGTVTWTNPWQKAGGDYDTTKSASFALGKVGNVPVRLDVTELVSDWVNGSCPNYGILLKRPPEEGDAFKTEIADLQRNLNQVRMKVYYHRASGGILSPGGQQPQKVQE